MQRRNVSRWIAVVAGALFAAAPVANASIETGKTGVFARPSSHLTDATDPSAVIEPTVNSASPSVAGLRFRAIGDPVSGGSWFQMFSVHSPTAFTNLGMMLDFGYAGLEGSPAMDFSFADATAGWKESFGPATGATWPMAAATGTATTDLVWQAHFADPVSQSFSMTLFAYNDIGSNVFDGARALWNGSEWSYAGVANGYSWEIYQSTVAGTPTVPVPSALLLGGVGLAAVGQIRRRLL